MKLAGKTAIVTGAGRDIGAAVAKKLASEGTNVAQLNTALMELRRLRMVVVLTFPYWSTNVRASFLS